MRMSSSKTSSIFLQIVEDPLGGYWETPSKWEGRRDAVLDLIGKATPGTFQPSLQIDGTDAKS